MPVTEPAGVYRPRHPERTVVYRLFEGHPRSNDGDLEIGLLIDVLEPDPEFRRRGPAPAGGIRRTHVAIRLHVAIDDRVFIDFRVPEVLGGRDHLFELHRSAGGSTKHSTH